jgi:hypothetical protein
MSQPLVSVIIPAFNQGQYLGKAIQSVLDQTYPDFEILVIDDGSTDDTPVVTRQFADPRIQYIYQDNRGLSGARNTGIRHAQGDYLSYLDSDDLFLPEKLELLVDFLENHPEYGLAAGQAVPIDENDQPIGKIFDTPLPQDTVRLLLGNPLHVGSVLVNRTWQDKAGLFDETLRSYEDWDMWLRLALLGCKMGWIARPVSLYRFHTAQMTRIGTQMTRATFAVLDKLYTRPDLPANWLAQQDSAYSSAHLRAMAQSYHAQDYANAQFHMREAVRLNPQLIEGSGENLANRLAALANSPKNPNPLDFLERIYLHLPDELEVLRQRTNQDLGKAAVEQTYAAYTRRDYATARHTARRAVQYLPVLRKNPQILFVYLKAYIRPVLEFIFSS